MERAPRPTNGAPPPAAALRRGAAGALALLSLSGAACRSAPEHAAAADHQVYGLLEEARAEIGIEEPFEIDPPEDSLRRRILAGEFDEEHPLPPLSLVDCLRIAAENSREFQGRREDLYRAGLALTREIWEFRVQETGTLGAFVSGVGGDALLADGVGFLTLPRLFATGAMAVGTIGVDFARDLSTSDSWTAVTSLTADVTQPLLRGFGRDVVREPLTQAERDVLYEARAYERFRRTFAFDVVSRFYGVLERVDTVQNELQNQDRLVRLRERNEAFAEAGRLSDIQVDQARQDELRAESRLVDARRSLQAGLDDLKLFLGLPIDAPLELDDGELESLDGFAFLDRDFDLDVAAELALGQRLDHATTLDRVADARRDVRVRADDLRAGLDVSLFAQESSDPNQPFDFEASETSWQLGVDVDLPLDRLPERNAYRASLIDLQAALRAAEDSADRIVSALREALRDLAAARRNLAIQTGAVELARRRVESANLNLEAGRASTRDLLEAQESLVQALNAATGARIDRLLAGYAFFRDMELLRVRPEGLVVELAPLELVGGVLEPPPEGTP